MTTKDIAAAVRRVESVLQRRPATGLHDDAPATARWQSRLRVLACHGNGTRVSTDMPAELGGSGYQVTPGWLFRAGLASCLATCIALGAAAEGIELASLEVSAGSRSDLRGLFGMADGTGATVSAGPTEIQLRARISAANAMHARPAHAWTLEELAHDARTSRSVLAERFQNLVGSSPMQYPTQWRMLLVLPRRALQSVVSASGLAR